jgi:hypothetical protein
MPTTIPEDCDDPTTTQAPPTTTTTTTQAPIITCEQGPPGENIKF